MKYSELTSVKKAQLRLLCHKFATGAMMVIVQHQDKINNLDLRTLVDMPEIIPLMGAFCVYDPDFEELLLEALDDMLVQAHIRMELPLTEDARKLGNGRLKAVLEGSKRAFLAVVADEIKSIEEESLGG